MPSNMPSLDGVAILEALPEGAILIDRDARICFVNTAAVRILGIEGDMPIGRSLADLPGGLGLAREGEDTGYLDLPDRWVRCRMTPIVVGAGPEAWNGTLILLDDVGQDIFARRDNADLVRALMHELRIPLTGISGYADILLLMDTLSDTQRRFISGIKANVGQLREELDSVLIVYRIRSGDLRLDRAAVDVVSVVREVAQAHAESYARRDLTLTIECQAPEMIVEADDRGVRDILSILLGHACQRSQPKSEVRVTVVDDRDEARVTIQDTDIHCDTERLLAHRHKYWHMPMIAAHGLVRLHGGRLWAEGVQGQGCIVSFTLPHSEA
ncbi:MAG TPA: histidine kinase dimerization/phospho-acceptor domain-containing protein [Roseiflexaceae bacterium]|nr:histidine kinase dimerization/phospho-acceptor domain-containing protein [Roseiflexaceae bacterium]